MTQSNRLAFTETLCPQWVHLSVHAFEALSHFEQPTFELAQATLSLIVTTWLNPLLSAVWFTLSLGHHTREAINGFEGSGLFLQSRSEVEGSHTFHQVPTVEPLMDPPSSLPVMISQTVDLFSTKISQPTLETPTVEVEDLHAFHQVPASTRISQPTLETPFLDSLSDMTVLQLRKLASQKRIPRASRLNKEDLLLALSQSH